MTLLNFDSYHKLSFVFLFLNINARSKIHFELLFREHNNNNQNRFSIILLVYEKRSLEIPAVGNNLSRWLRTIFHLSFFFLEFAIVQIWMKYNTHQRTKYNAARISNSLLLRTLSRQSDKLNHFINRKDSSRLNKTTKLFSGIAAGS